MEQIKKYINKAVLIIILLLSGVVLFGYLYSKINTDDETDKNQIEIVKEGATTYQGFELLGSFLGAEEVEELKDKLKIVAVRDTQFKYEQEQEYFSEEGIFFYIWGDNGIYKFLYNIRSGVFSYLPITEITAETIKEERHQSYVKFYRYPSEFEYKDYYVNELPEELKSIFEETEVVFITALADYLGQGTNIAGVEVKEIEADPANESIIGFNIELTDKNAERFILTAVFNQEKYEFREVSENFPLYSNNLTVENGTAWEKIGEAHDMFSEE